MVGIGRGLTVLSYAADWKRSDSHGCTTKMLPITVALGILACVPVYLYCLANNQQVQGLWRVLSCLLISTAGSATISSAWMTFIVYTGLYEHFVPHQHIDSSLHNSEGSESDELRL